MIMKYFKILGVALIVFIVLFVFRIIGFTYTRLPNNNPLRSAVHVEKLDGKTLVMADGRQLRLETLDSDALLTEILNESKFLIELDPWPDQMFQVYASIRDRHTPIGSDLHAPIVIPIFPFDRENLRYRVGFATLIDDPIKNPKQVTE